MRDQWDVIRHVEMGRWDKETPHEQSYDNVEDQAVDAERRSIMITPYNN